MKGIKVVIIAFYAGYIVLYHHDIWLGYKDYLTRVNRGVGNKQIVHVDNTDEINHRQPNISSVPLSADILKFIWEKTNEKGVDYLSFLALIKTESNFNPELIYYNDNGTIDYGLVQINSANIKRLSKKIGIKKVDVFNPYHNIMLGLEELMESREYWKREYAGDNLDLVMYMSYNMGNYGSRKFIKKHGLIDSQYIRKLKKNRETLLKNLIK